MPPGVLRPLETVDAAVVHVVVVREPYEDAKLSRAAAQRRISHRSMRQRSSIFGTAQNLPRVDAPRGIICPPQRTLY
jgi:hypothetical protein